VRWLRRSPSVAAVDEDRPVRAAALYRHFVPPGGLVFDVGANVGDRTAVFVELGARVVAVEPQAQCAARLRERFGGRVAVEEAAAGAQEGTAELLVASAHTISSLNADWVERVQESGRFSSYRWDDAVRVPVLTLDLLIERHGLPDLVKVDVEGYELEVLRGLSRPVPTLSFEFDFELLEPRLACVDRLAELGMRTFNFSRGETLELALPDWVGVAAIKDYLRRTPRDVLFFGDVYARQ
jgi:FkbM family methyltransferase